MMCDNLSLYKPSVPLTSITSPSDPPRIPPSVKRKLSDVEENPASDDEEEEEEDEEDSTTPCPILQRRHSDTVATCSYGSAIVKRRCTYSSVYEQEEEKRSVLVESYRKLRGVKKPKLQVSLLICNLIKRLEKTFAKSPPVNEQPMHYYSPPRSSYRSTSSDSLYLSCTLSNEEIESSNQQYSSYESEKVVNDPRTTTMYHPTSAAETYWLAQSNFAVPVVSSSDDGEISFHAGDGDYLDLSDNTLSSSSSSSSSADCSSCSSASTSKLLVDTNNNHHATEDYYHYPSPPPAETFFYPPNETKTMDLLSSA